MNQLSGQPARARPGGPAFPFLTEQESDRVLRVLDDLDICIDGDWALSGSLSYRLLLPSVKPDPGLRDIDISMSAAAGQDARCLVNPAIRNYFLVIEISEAGRGFYFRLAHRETRIRVDLYTPLFNTQCCQIEIAGKLRDLILPEENMYAMLRDQIRRIHRQEAITEKWIRHNQVLWEAVDQQATLDLLQQRVNEFASWLSPTQQSISMRQLVEEVLKAAPFKPHRCYSAGKGSVATPNGITVHSQKELRAFMNNAAPGRLRRTLECLKGFAARLA